MRQYRGKRLDNDEWVYGYYKTLISYEVTKLGALRHYITEQCSEANEYEHTHEVDAQTVGQYTGQQDKELLEIYEDDFVVDKFGNVGEIIFHRSWSAFCFKWIYTLDEAGKRTRTNGCKAIWNDWQELSVIGNAFDNPELLGEGTE